MGGCSCLGCDLWVTCGPPVSLAVRAKRVYAVLVVWAAGSHTAHVCAALPGKHVCAHVLVRVSVCGKRGADG